MADQYLAPDGRGGLCWGPLTAGRLLRRYKRFLADVELEDGSVVTAHTPNTGRMTGCSEPGRRVWLSRQNNPKRKYPYAWEMIEMPGTLVGINTLAPNRLVAEAASRGVLSALLPGPLKVEREVAVGHSRLDLKLTDERGRELMLEIKNCTLVENSVGYFPDAVTARGARHLQELAALAVGGRRAGLFILVQRNDAESFSPADHIDPHWGQSLREAVAQGVELWAWRAALDQRGLRLDRPLAVNL